MKISHTIFQNFSEKMSNIFLLEIFVSLGSFLLPEIKKIIIIKKKKTRPTDPTWQILPPVKHFFFFLLWPYDQFDLNTAMVFTKIILSKIMSYFNFPNFSKCLIYTIKTFSFILSPSMSCAKLAWEKQRYEGDLRPCLPP